MARAAEDCRVRGSMRFGPRARRSVPPPSIDGQPVGSAGKGADRGGPLSDARHPATPPSSGLRFR